MQPDSQSGLRFKFHPFDILNSRAWFNSYKLTFGHVISTAGNPALSPNGKVLRVGFTITSRKSTAPDFQYSTPVVTANFSDSISATYSSTMFSKDRKTFSEQDTFYGFTAQQGAYIQSISISFGPDAAANESLIDYRRGIDDFAIITSMVRPP